MSGSLRDVLFGRINYEREPTRPRRQRSFSLDGIRRLLARLDHPEHQFPAIHIAGTKGKGSTATLTAEALRAQGYRVGLYTSPHLIDLEERYWVDGKTIAPLDLDRLIESMIPLLEPTDDAGVDVQPPTFFEITTALAFEHFRQCEVDVAVVEVGLGGRLDSTNVCEPAVSVITNIGLDHTHLLGKRLTDIAREKAGIIKPKIPVVSGERSPGPADVIREVADRNQAPLLLLGDHFGCHFDRQTAADVAQVSAEEHERFDFWMRTNQHQVEWRDVQISMTGQHQCTNSALALAAVHLFMGEQPPQEKRVRAGLSACRIPARIEIVSRQPPIIVDMAHNLPSLVALTETLDRVFPDRQRLLAFGVSRDKNLVEMISHIVDHYDRLIVSRFLGNPRSASPAVLSEIAREQCIGRTSPRLSPEQIQIADSPGSTWQTIERMSLSPGVTCIAGSAFFAAEMKSSQPVVPHVSAV